jgi:hypothetical protein
MTKRTTRPAWRRLTWIGALGCGALLLTPRLAIARQHPTLLLLLWVALFYGALTVWLRRNNTALEHEPPALDCVGRPIINQDAPLFAAEPESRPATVTPAPRHQPETM